MTVQQVRDIVGRLPIDAQQLRVEAVQALFSRVVNLDDFHAVFADLSEEEADELAFRLGYTNCLNPVFAEFGARAYKLNLKTPDEHKMATVLVKLAIAEPGENWVDERFKRKESMNWSPGWQLPAEWEEEVVHYGVLETRYTDQGKGCKPDEVERLRLKPRFLCGGRADESDG